jgi:hypothetical protein
MTEHGTTSFYICYYSFKYSAYMILAGIVEGAPAWAVAMEARLEARYDRLWARYNVRPELHLIVSND